jgi:tetratricopeptide (TPR) repeat protein
MLGGRIVLHQGNSEEATKEIRAAIELLEGLAREFSASPVYRENLAVAKMALAASTSAEPVLRESLQLFEVLSKQYPTIPRYRMHRANGYLDLGWRFLKPRSTDAAENAFRQSMELYKNLLLESPSHGDYRWGVRASRMHWVELLTAAGRLPEAATVAEDALSAFKGAQVNVPTEPELHLELARNYAQLAEIYDRLGQPERAVETGRKAVSEWQEYGVDLPATHGCQGEMARTQLALAAVLKKLGRSQEAKEVCDGLFAVYEKLIAQPAKTSEDLKAMADVYQNLGNLSWGNNQTREAEDAYRKSIGVFEKLVAEHPGQPSYRAELAWRYRTLARHLVKLPDRSREALEMRVRDVSIFKKLAAEFPDNPAWPEQLAHGQRERGFDLRGMKQPQEAEDSFREAIKVLERSAAQFPKAVPSHKDLLADTYGVLALLLSANGRPEETEALYRKCLELAPQNANGHNNFAWFLATWPDPKFRDSAVAVAEAKTAVELGPNAGTHWNTLGVAQYRAGDWKAAVAGLEKSMERRKGGDSFDWFFLAMARWNLGQKADARKWYDQAVKWMEKNQPKNEELARFRAEAETLLELKK